MVNKLKDLETFEVSLVGEAANERDFLLLKSKDGGVKMDSLLENILQTKLENEDKVDKILEESEAQKEVELAVKSILKVMQTFSDELPDNFMKMLGKVTHGAFKYPNPYKYGYPYMSPMGMSEHEEMMDKQEMGIGDLGDLNPELSDEAENAIIGSLRMLSEFGDELPDGVIQNLANLIGGEDMMAEVLASKEEVENEDDVNKQEVAKSLDDLPDNVKPVIEQLFKEHKDTVEKAEKLEKQLSRERNEKRKQEFIQKAKQLDNLPVNPDDFGVVMKSIADKAPEEFEQIETLLKSLNESVKKGALFEEVGSSASSSGSGAWGKIEKAAKELVQKDVNMTQEQAISKVIATKPELYSEYLQEGGKE